MKPEQKQTTPAGTTGYIAALLLSVVTLITFALALTAIPNSGAFCPGDCFEYPYLDTLSEYPGDYLWMYPAVILMLVFVVWVIAIHAGASPARKIFSLSAVAFALMSAMVLVPAYFIQFSVVPASLMKGETQGIALLTQYNPNGIFIVLEELGYFLMSLSFVFLAPVFQGKTKHLRTIRWVFITAFAFTFISFIIITAIHGIYRMDRFEVAAISICWLALIVNGFLTAGGFRKS